jgi:pimeloyl-ACP methyl ester carboxylesterase
MHQREQARATPRPKRDVAARTANKPPRSSVAELQSRIGLSGLQEALARNGKSGAAAKEAGTPTTSVLAKSPASQGLGKSAADSDLARAQDGKSKPLILYIGGAADDWFSHIVEDYSSGKGLYFSWTDYSAVAMLMKLASAAGRPVAVAGHSLGGSAALGAVGAAGVYVDLVITIDPVGYPGSFDRSKIGYWVNVLAAPATHDKSDYIADLGVKTGKGITGKADKFITSKQHHWNFVAMMNEADGEALIRNVGAGGEEQPAPK